MFSLPVYVDPQTARNSAAFVALENERQALRDQFPHWDEVQVNHVVSLSRFERQFK